MKHPACGILFFLELAVLASIAHAEVVPNETFIRAVDVAGLTFRETFLSNYVTVPIIENKHMNYEFAARLKTPQLEIRYAIRTFDPSPREPFVAPETMAAPLFLTTVLNIEKAEVSKTAVFASDYVKSVFNADWGASTFIIPKKEFGGSFDRCMVVYIYKKRAGAFTFYLFNSSAQEAVVNEIGKVFYALRFR